jgi:hypothetical protein
MSDRRRRTDYDEIARIEGRLDELLTAVIHRRKRAAAGTSELRPRFVDLSGPLPPPRYSPADLIGSSDVVGKCLRWGIRQLGSRLGELGNTDLMRDALERVVDRDPANTGRRFSIVDHARDGIRAARHDIWVC